MTDQQTDEDRDAELAWKLYTLPTKERDSALVQLAAAVRAGDIDAMRAAYQGKKAFYIGIASAYGQSELLVVGEILKNSDLSLDILGVFFGELGGRFMVDGQHNICVFSMLANMECTKHIDQAEEVERRASRIIEVVRYLVEKLGMPIRQRHEYSLQPSFTGHQAPLLELARDAGAWACYAAFAQFIRDPCFVGCLESILQSQDTGASSNYWVKRFAAEVHEDPLGRLVERPGLHPEHTAILNAEGERKMQTREHMQALLLMQSKDPGNAAARDVMNHHNLSRVILEQASENAYFYRGVPKV